MDKSAKTQQNVVTMSDYQPHSGYEALSLVEGYWDALRAGRMMPKRAEIDPRGVESALEHAFILERVAPGVARMRVAGAHLSDVMGMEARGMPLTAFFDQDSRTRIAGLLEEVFQTPGCAEIIMHALAKDGQPPMEARMILLPLKSDLGDVSRILGCFVCLGSPKTGMRRFDVRDVKFRSLAPPTTIAQQNSPVPASGFAEAKAPFVSAPDTPLAAQTDEANAKRPPYLRLVKSDE